MHNDPWRAVRIGLCLMPWPFGEAGGAELPRPDEAMDYLAPAAIAEIHPRWTTVHRRESATWGEFLVWPAATLGGLVDSNPFQLRRSGRAALGTRFTPSVLAERDTGVHRTTLYGIADLKTFPGRRGADTTDGRVGLLHDWALRRDLTVRLQGEIARRTDPFNNTQLLLASASRGLLRQTVAIGDMSVQKTFDTLFVSAAGSALRSGFTLDGAKHGEVGSRRLSDQTVLAVRGRAGAWIAPAFFAFAEQAANWRSFDTVASRSNGTRTVMGLGAARFGLLGGEIYAGRQAQAYRAPDTTLAGPVLGGRVTWSPTRAWTVSAQYDRSLGDAAVGTAADPLGTPIRQDTAIVDLRCILSPLWTARATIAAIWADYVGTRRRDRLAVADLRVDYAVWRSLDLTAGVRVAALGSSVPAAAYHRVEGTLGATYHY